MFDKMAVTNYTKDVSIVFPNGWEITINNDDPINEHVRFYKDRSFAKAFSLDDFISLVNNDDEYHSGISKE